MKKSIMTRYHNSLIAGFFILSITIIGLSGIVACSKSTPSVSLGKETIIKVIEECGQNKCLKVVSFDKTNGMGDESYYEMEYKIQVEVIGSPCIGIKRDNSFFSIKNASRSGLDSGWSDLILGTKFEVNGKIPFEKTENGWRATPNAYRCL